MSIQKPDRICGKNLFQIFFFCDFKIEKSKAEFLIAKKSYINKNFTQIRRLVDFILKEEINFYKKLLPQILLRHKILIDWL